MEQPRHSSATTSANGAPVAQLQERKGVEQAHAQATEAMFDQLASRYDLLNRLLSGGIDTLWRKRAVQELKGAPQGEILDMCAGTLDLSAEVEGRFPKRSVVAADFSQKMLDAGMARNITQRTITVKADAMDLPFEEGRFGGAIAGFGLRNVAKTAVAIGELFRVLKPSGRLVILEFYRPQTLVPKSLHWAYVGVVVPQVGRLVGGNQAAYQYLADSMQGFITREECAQIFRDQGFVNVRSFDLLFGIASLVIGEKPAKQATPEP